MNYMYGLCAGCWGDDNGESARLSSYPKGTFCLMTVVNSNEKESHKNKIMN